MRLSQEVTGWAFLAELGGVRHPALAVGLDSVSPFTRAGGHGSLFTRALGWGLPQIRSLEEIPWNDGPVDRRWRVVRHDDGTFSVLAPDGTRLVHDLGCEEPPGWREAAETSGTVMLVVSHVLPLGEDPVAALARETREGLVCVGRVAFGGPVHLPGPPTARFLLDPVGTLQELAFLVYERLLSMDEAKRRARHVEETRRLFTGEEGRKLFDEPPTLSAGEMLELLLTREDFLDHRGLTDYAYAYRRLVAEVADACGDATAWRTAALHTVDAAVDLVAERCDRAVFEDADALLARMTDGLDAPGATDDPVQREAMLLASARLRMATRGPLERAADHYARDGTTDWAARMTADLYRTWFTGEEPLQKESHRLTVEAGHLVVRALELTGGTRRVRLLASLAQIIADADGVHQGAARAALSAWLDSPTADDPDVAVFLLRTVRDLPPETFHEVLVTVFGTSLSEFVAVHGRAVTAKVVGQTVNLARERGDRSLLRSVLDWSEPLVFHRDPAHYRQLLEARPHALPDDPLDCAAAERALTSDGTDPPDPTAAPAAPDAPGLPELPDSWTPGQRRSALLHLAAHARDLRRPATGLALLKEVRDDGPEFRLLIADLHHQCAETGRPAARPLPFPWGYHTYAALTYASLGLEQLALACLVPFAQHLDGLRGEELQGALAAIIVDAPNFDTSGAPGLAGTLRDLVHSAVWRLTAEIETLPMSLMLGLHQAGKGAELGAWWRIEGPLTLPAPVQHHLRMLRDLESPTTSGDGSPNLLNVLDGDHRPGGGDDTQLARNLRWRVSSLVDHELRRRSPALLNDGRLWGRVHELLDDRTVLLTWFLPSAVNGAAVLLAVTRQGGEIVVHLGDGPDGDADRHPVADRVEAARTEIERDPLFDEVTPEGRRLLTTAEMPVGGDRWDIWRALGKDRALLWPHGALHYLPVALCRAGDRLIADDWTVTTIAGLEALLPAGAPTRPARTAVLASATGGVPYGLHAEPALEEHARRVAGAVGADAVTGPAATRARLLAELATADVVHIAAHGTLDRDAPWLHCLYLAPDEDDDGRVSAHDFLELDLRGLRLVTLAACESALGRFDRGDNVRGIPAALITAGAGAVVGCLWPVRPEPATHFHHEMHRRIAQGTDPERAFRAAQLATRAAYPHYRDWGSFTYLHGRSEGAHP
ncbi:CHAT domain-containing protein [Streptomyces sp. JNUCC 64]